uniref:Uncharacterized protein n=1 Tax=Rhizophora mucronata TaxID=61149 RepID=A0A2P2NJY9_RHIMU
MRSGYVWRREEECGGSWWSFSR